MLMFMHPSPKLDAALIADAATRLDAPEGELELSSHVQSFSSTALGFPGVAGHAFTDGLVIVVRSGQGACVYVASAREGTSAARMAYRIADTNEAFDQALAARELMDATLYAGEYDHEDVPEPASFEVRGSTRGVKRGPHALARAIDEAYMISRYGTKSEPPRQAEVVVAGTDTVVTRTHAEEGDVRIERLDAIEPFSYAARFPRVEA